MSYHPPGHSFHKLSWFPRKYLGDTVCGDCIKTFEAAWIKSQEEFWARVDKLCQFEAADAETGEKVSDEAHPGIIGLPNAVGLPTSMIKLNDLLRLREVGRLNV